MAPTMERSNQQIDWKAEYDALMQALGSVTKITAKNENRNRPRFKIDSKQGIRLRMSDQFFPVIDVSAIGLSFHSKRDFIVGNPYSLWFGDQIHIQVKIQNCRFDREDEKAVVGHFRVGSNFIDEMVGYQCVVVFLKHAAGKMGSSVGG